MIFTFKSVSPLNTKIRGPEDGTAPLYIVKTPLLRIPWVTSITRCEGGTIRRICDVVWDLQDPNKIRVRTKEWPLDEYLSKAPESGWYENHRQFTVGGRRLKWLDSLRPYTRVEVDTEAVVAVFNHRLFSKTKLSLEVPDLEPQVVDMMIVITPVIMERWREVRR